ncbi:ATPase [Sphaerisporangium melleum]|uniref:histidine kinase n=1 Tax=Sphaerisporangium melleum TaxID=321316 RepID=A0A917VH08_9ACTN|nr:nitrate- and nitrite sensing domain-containing protein [Sphaerisporangium melleum]GGK79656.1 ATPase [Sphaerisporangium melleum]GII69674.1 ATPase [Sphaerisporangium melleum]
MGGRTRSIKFKILALVLVPLVSLLGIWAYSAAITVQDGLDLLRVRTIYDDLVAPTGNLASEIQGERFQSVVFLSSPGSERSELDAARARTDQARAALERAVLDSAAEQESSPQMYQRVNELIETTHRLPDIRARVDSRSFSRLLTLDAYRLISDAVGRVYDSLKFAGDLEIGPPTRAVTLIDRSRDLMGEQAALLAGVVRAGAMTNDERAVFGTLVTKRRLLYDMGFQLLDPDLRQPYLVLQNSTTYTRFASVEDQVVQDVTPGRPLPGGSVNWGDHIIKLTAAFDVQNGIVAGRIADRAAPLAGVILWRIALTLLVGLIAVGVSLYVSVRFGRRITAELVELQRAALQLAHERLPRVVQRLRLGEDVDVAAESPPIRTGPTEEIAGVSEAFTSVQTTAIEAAVGQAEIRKGVGKVFLNLARRNQSLLHRQLSMLDAIERKVTDPDLLDELFGIDHLTTRMRRHAEGLIILSGATPGRGWRNPIPLYDVVRAAVEEVEDYLRVHVTLSETVSLAGAAATDVIHLIAELVENATIFSPPQTHVEVRGEMVARGYAIEIEDRGLGLSPAEMEQINQRLADPPEFDLADSDRLGLFVVGRLAARRDIRVSLRPSPYGGTTAIVLLPESLVMPTEPSGDPYSVEQLTGQPGWFGAGRGLTSALEGGSRPGGRSAALEGPGANGSGRKGGEGAGGRRTGGNLPHRVRQASLAPQLRDPAPASGRDPREAGPRHDAAGGPAADPPQPSPDMFTSFRAGWERAHEGEGNAS